MFGQLCFMVTKSNNELAVNGIAVGYIIIYIYIYIYIYICQNICQTKIVVVPKDPPDGSV